MIVKIALEPKQTFWNLTANLLLDAAALSWAKVFGPWSDDTHWTNVLPSSQHETTRTALLVHLGLTAEEWERQRVSIISYRDQMVAHHDLEATLEKFPHYDVAFEAACFMFDRIRGGTNEDWLGNIPSNLDRWSESVSQNMRPIVLKAHAGSATLGANVPD